jgi:hypothetical protein
MQILADDDAEYDVEEEIDLSGPEPLIASDPSVDGRLQDPGRPGLVPRCPRAPAGRHWLLGEPGPAGLRGRSARGRGSPGA